LQAGKRESAEVECRKAAAICEKVVGDNASVNLYQESLGFALDALGDVLRISGQPREAKACYDRAIALREQFLKPDPTHVWYSYLLVGSTWRRALTRAQLGDMAGASADIRRALKVSDGLFSRSGRHVYLTACCHSALAGLAGRAGSGVSAADGQEAAARAIEWLDRAVANGFRNTNLLRIEPALDPLRNRADFKKLIAELEENHAGQREKK
jgi:tetratricopeptide (TPR) repeat protein